MAVWAQQDRICTRTQVRVSCNGHAFRKRNLFVKLANILALLVGGIVKEMAQKGGRAIEAPAGILEFYRCQCR